MQPLFDLGVQTSQWLQAAYPQLAFFFDFISRLGLEEFYLAVIPLIYWSFHKSLGRNLAYVFLFANAWVALLKHGLRGPRPFWLDGKLALWPEESYGIPSGHAALATAVYLFIAGWVRKVWVWGVAILMVILMGLSRIYLGSHFIHDVLGGTLLALLILVGYVFWRQHYAAGFAKRILGYRLMVALFIPIGIALLYLVIRLLIGAPNLNVAWATHIDAAELASIEAVATAVGSLLGAGIGLILEGSRVRFRTQGPIWQKGVRYLVGIIVTVILWRGLGLLFDLESLWIAISLRVLRYALVLLWVSYYAPMLFVRLKLAQADPPPIISMTPP